MRRVVVLALLALALPIAASAGTIDILDHYGNLSFTSLGIVETGSQVYQFGSFSVPSNQSLASLTFSTGACLTGCNGSGIPNVTTVGSSATFSSVGSTFDVVCTVNLCVNHTPLFTGSFTGTITLTLVSQIGQSQVWDLTGTVTGMLADGHTVTGITEQTNITTTHQLGLGIAHLQTGRTNLFVPEPGTLGLLGTGLVGLGGMLRRRILGA